MIEFKVYHEDLGDLIGALQQLSTIEIDMAPLGPEIQRILESENQMARVAGLDRDGRELEPVKHPDDPRRGGTGPPLAPRGASSRVVANHRVEIGQVGANFLRGRAYWVDADFLRYHAEGRGRYGSVPVRDVIGTTEDADKFVGDAFEEYVRLRLEEQLSRIWGEANAGSLRAYLGST